MDRLDTAPVATDVGGSPGGPVEPRWRPVLRFALAAVVVGLAALAWWARQPHHLPRSIDVVGWPAYWNYTYTRPFAAYRLFVYAVPVGLLVLYSALAWRGPLRRPLRPRLTSSIPLTPPDVSSDAPSVSTATPAGLVAAGLRLLVPAVPVALAASTRSSGGRPRLSGRGWLAGVGYVVVVLVIVAAALAWQRRPGNPLSGYSRRGVLAVVNGVVGGVAALAALWVASHRTVVIVAADHSIRHYAWLPWWLAGLGAVVLVGWAVLRLRGGLAATAVELRVLLVVVGSAFVFMSQSRLPLPTKFQGFDDAQYLAGGHLLQAGLFPWRDLVFIHGLYPDVLVGNIGFTVFGDTRWGGQAGLSVLLTPLAWVLLYLLAVWVAGRNWLVPVAFVATLLSGVLPEPDPRFILVPAVLVLLGEALGRRRPGWMIALMLVLFVECVIVPEMFYLAIPATVVVVAVDVVHRDRAAPLRRAFGLTWWYLGTGVVALAIWASYLAANHALGAFVDYYRIFGPGHDASGAHPPFVGDSDWARFYLGIVLTLLVIWLAVARIRRRGAWAARDWTTVAMAGCVGLYGEKALGRFDAPHVSQVFMLTLPLCVLVGGQLLGYADRAAGAALTLARGAARPPVWRWAIGRPATIVVVAALVVADMGMGHGPSWWQRIRSTPGYQHLTVQAEPSYPRLGYGGPGADGDSTLADLQTVLDTYAPGNAPVFDMSNSPGYFYYLLDRRPGTRFVHVSMAQTTYSQRLLIGELRHSRPPLVIFNTSSFGLSRWDGISNSVRHFLVSNYVLHNWVPLLQTHGVLVMLRADLAATAPPVPALHVPPQTADLWDSMPICGWRDVPDYLPTRPAGRSLDLPVTPLGPRQLTSISGWAFDARSHAPARSILIVHGDQVLGTVPVAGDRPDVTRRLGRAGLRSGFTASALTVPGTTLTIYAITADGRAHPLSSSTGPPPPSALRQDDGSAVPTGPPVLGRIEHVIRGASTQVGRVQVPDGVALPRFDLLSLHGTAPFGTANFAVAYSQGWQSGLRLIAASSLPFAGQTLRVRVGSCLQWHGYDRQLYLLQPAHGGAVSSVTLSGVAGAPTS